jgi:hypothetical protein
VLTCFRDFYAYIQGIHITRTYNGQSMWTTKLAISFQKKEYRIKLCALVLLHFSTEWSSWKEESSSAGGSSITYVYNEYDCYLSHQPDAIKSAWNEDSIWNDIWQKWVYCSVKGVWVYMLC